MLALNNLTDLLYSLAINPFLLAPPDRTKEGLWCRSVPDAHLTGEIFSVAANAAAFYPAHHGPIPVAFSFYELILIIAMIPTILPLFLNLYALKGLRSSTVGILLYINPLLNFMIAILHFGERLNSLQLVAYGVIFFSVILFNIRIGRKDIGYLYQSTGESAVVLYI